MAWNRLSNYKTTVKQDAVEGTLSVVYHSTTILAVHIENGRKVITLDTGGELGDWHTASQAIGSVTTKRKLNQAAKQFGLGFSIHQHRHKWYLTTKAGTFLWDDDTTYVFDAETGIEWGVFSLFIGERAHA